MPDSTTYDDQHTGRCEAGLRSTRSRYHQRRVHDCHALSHTDSQANSRSSSERFERTSRMTTHGGAHRATGAHGAAFFAFSCSFQSTSSQAPQCLSECALPLWSLKDSCKASRHIFKCASAFVKTKGLIS